MACMAEKTEALAESALPIGGAGIYDLCPQGRAFGVSTVFHWFKERERVSRSFSALLSVERCHCAQRLNLSFILSLLGTAFKTNCVC